MHTSCSVARHVKLAEQGIDSFEWLHSPPRPHPPYIIINNNNNKNNTNISNTNINNITHHHHSSSRWCEFLTCSPKILASPGSDAGDPVAPLEPGPWSFFCFATGKIRKDHEVGTHEIAQLGLLIWSLLVPVGLVDFVYVHLLFTCLRFLE